MNLLHRVFYGRVAKARPASTDRDQGDISKSSSRSPTQCRQVRSPSLRAGSGIVAPSLAGSQSLQHSEAFETESASSSNIRIKQEHEEGALTMTPAKSDNLPSQGQQEEYLATGSESSEDAPRGISLEEDPSQDGLIAGSSDQGASFEVGFDDVHVEHPDEDDAVQEELDASVSDFLDNDEPIPSIEEDDCDLGQEEQPRSRQTTPPFLHGMAHRPVGAHEPISGDGLDEEIEDGDFAEELSGAIEETLLIDNNALRYWLRHKRSTAGIENWPNEACRLYKLLFLRGLYPMFHSQWTWNFLDYPMPGELFTPLGSDSKCFLKAEKSHYHASKALIRLFNLHGYISDYRQRGTQERIAPLIQKEIRRYVLWAESDGDFVKRHEYVSPVFVITYKDAQVASTGQPIVKRIRALVENYRSEYVARGIQEYPRCIYVFVVVQHIVLVMVADTEHPDEEEVYPLAELDLSQRSHWLDYSLGIAITVMLARDSLLACRRAFPKTAEVEYDPDL